MLVKTYLTPDEAFSRADDDDAYLEIIHHHPEVFAAVYFDYEIEPYQSEMLHWGREHDRSIIRVPAQHGKLLSLSTKIPTPSGWTNMGDLKVGDEVFDENGNPTRVAAKSSICTDEQCYRVKSQDRTSVVAGARHEWLARIEDWRQPEIVETPDLHSKRGRSARIQLAKPLQLPEAELPVDPYVFGFWLGDGTSSSGGLTVNENDYAHVLLRICEAGYGPGVVQHFRGAYRFTALRLVTDLRLLGVVGHKHIPIAYLRASEAQRRDLLHGLIDSDGHVMPDGQVEITQMRKELAEQIAELVRTLGCRAVVYTGEATIDGVSYGTKYRVTFYMADAASLPRKRERCREPKKYYDHYVLPEPCETVDTVCIQVANPSGLYLCGEGFLPTHNSTLMSKVMPCWEIVCNPNIRIILLMKTEKDAFSYSEQIRNKLSDENELIVKHFGPFYDGKQTWTNAQFNVLARQIKDPHYTMEFYGAGGAVLGHRCDLTIVDDVVTEETAKTVAQRETQLKWFREQVQTGPKYMWPREAFSPTAIRDRLQAGDEDMARWVQHRLGTETRTGYPVLLKTPAGIYWPTDIKYQRIIVCGTTFHPKDLYNDLQNDETYHDLYFDCYVTDPVTGERGALWEGQMPLEALEAEKASSGTLSFNKRFRNIALDEGELVFKEAFLYGGEFEGETFKGILDRESGREWGEYEEKWFRTFGIDPASGGSSRFCTWPSAVVLGVDEDSENRTMYFIDIFRSQMGIEDIISLILDGRPGGGIPGFYGQYRYHRGLIEANACQRWLLQHHRITEAMEKDPNLHLEAHFTGGNKWDEVMGMSSIVRYCQNSQYSVPYSTPAARLKARPLIEQFEQFPKGIFDFVMASWFATLAAESMVSQWESFYMAGHEGRMVANPIYVQETENVIDEENQEGWMSDRRKRLLGLL